MSLRRYSDTTLGLAFRVLPIFVCPEAAAAPTPLEDGRARSHSPEVRSGYPGTGFVRIGTGCGEV